MSGELVYIFIIHTASAYLPKVHHENFNKGLLLFLPESDDTHHFAVCLMNAFWKLHSCQPVNPVLSPLSSIGERCLINLEQSSVALRKTVLCSHLSAVNNLNYYSFKIFLHF